MTLKATFQHKALTDNDLQNSQSLRNSGVKADNWGSGKPSQISDCATASGELMLDDLEDLAGRDLDGRYLLEKFLDRGSYGAVYRAIDRKFNQSVAIKVGLSSREFMKEARLAAEVKHSHIIQVTDFGSDNGLAYLVMEFLDGENLEKVFQNQDCRLTFDQFRKFVDEIGDALAHAHEDHLIHRDLKPRNIILNGRSSKLGTSKGAGKFVLLDFGIAAKLDSDGTQRNRTQDGAGTVEYMAPELLSKRPQATPASDIYAFGVILYQLMTGRVPFPQSDSSHMALAECLNKISNSPPPRFDEILTDRVYPKPLEDLVLQCLEKDPIDRPGTMSEVRQRFLEVFDGSYERQDTAVRSPQASFNTCRPSDTSEAQEVYVQRKTQPKWTQSAPQPAASQPKPSRGPWMATTFGFVLATSLTAAYYFLVLKSEPAYAVLTYEQGHVVGKEVNDEAPLSIEMGETVRFTFLIEGPHDDIVHFEQPDSPEGMRIETTNGPVPNKSKCFAISLTDLDPDTTELPAITLRARSASQHHPFEKTLRLAIKRPKS